jgi:UTP--glucose-1-phosphate uridylyltransferase
MNIRKAVITAASRAQRMLPLQHFVDRDGVEKTALQIILEEVIGAGVEEIGIVICPGDEEAYRAAAGGTPARLHFIAQPAPRGYGDAVLRAAAFVGDEAFVHLVADHLYLSRTDKPCARQLVEVAQARSCSVSAVQATRESMLPYYGAIGGRRVAQQPRLYEVELVLEKPTPTQAEQQLIVPGLRAGHYLCLFGMHVLRPAVMQLLAEASAQLRSEESLSLSPTLSLLARRERYLALEVQGSRYNIGVKYGLLVAQLALALAGAERDEVLAQLVELLAARHRGES